MANGLSLRLAEPVDVPAIDALAAESIRALHVGAYDDAVIAEAIDHAYGVDWQLIRDGTYFVAMIAGSVVGAGGWSYRGTIAGAHGPDNAPAPPLTPAVDAARVRAFYISPDYARRGIGALLLRTSEAAAQMAGFARAQLTSTIPAVPFYAAHGYVPEGIFDLKLPRGRNLELRLMGKCLTSTL